MKLETAIEILEVQVQIYCQVHQGNTRAAFKLGIEALKEVQHLRDCGNTCVKLELPGETKE